MPECRRYNTYITTAYENFLMLYMLSTADAKYKKVPKCAKMPECKNAPKIPSGPFFSRCPDVVRVQSQEMHAQDFVVTALPCVLAVRIPSI